ncbi:MAG: class I SAM-dependent methyltransferase [Nitrospiria bacterium]
MARMEEKQVWIKRFFSKTGPTYDEVVHRFTFGIDRLWKKKILARINSPRRVLDLACGTGILAFAIARKYPESRVIGVDITKGYLDIARSKAEAMGVKNVSFVHCRAEEYASDERFDAITTSYLPKYADLPLLIRNLRELIAPGGILLMHDFTYPTAPILRKTFAFYFKLAQPIGGWWYPEWKEVLLELPNVIRETEWVAETTSAMAREGFCEIQVESLTLQGAALVSAVPSSRGGLQRSLR